MYGSDHSLGGELRIEYAGALSLIYMYPIRPSVENTIFTAWSTSTSIEIGVSKASSFLHVVDNIHIYDIVKEFSLISHFTLIYSVW